jgi:hypothetical protein
MFRICPPLRLGSTKSEVPPPALQTGLFGRSVAAKLAGARCTGHNPPETSLAFTTASWSGITWRQL